MGTSHDSSFLGWRPHCPRASSRLPGGLVATASERETSYSVHSRVHKYFAARAVGVTTRFESPTFFLVGFFSDDDGVRRAQRSCLRSEKSNATNMTSSRAWRFPSGLALPAA